LIFDVGARRKRLKKNPPKTKPGKEHRYGTSKGNPGRENVQSPPLATGLHAGKEKGIETKGEKGRNKTAP